MATQFRARKLAKKQTVTLDSNNDPKEEVEEVPMKVKTKRKSTKTKRKATIEE